jgi:putative addiction module CopG family antidote
MTVQLDAESEVLIHEKVASGRYRDAAEVVREALRALDERERFEQLRGKVAAGFAQADRGDLIDYTAELRDELIRSALRRAQAGEQPNPDVCP